jgi:hypothetical protein
MTTKDLPKWFIDLPYQTLQEGGDCCVATFEGEIFIWVYDTGGVVAIAPDPEEMGREAICEVTIPERGWIENFSKNGWNKIFKP